MPLFDKENIKNLEHSKIEIMRNWAAVNGNSTAVVKLTPNNSGRYVMAGTLPMSMYEIEKTGNINQVKVVFFLQVLQTM